MRQLEKRFGPLPDATRARLESATADQLLEWGERVLMANRLADVFEGES